MTNNPSDLERLRAEVTTLFSHRGDGIPTQYVYPFAEQVDAVITEVITLRAALEPFALLFGDGEGVNLNDPIREWLTMAQLHAAWAALQPNTTEETGG